MGTRPEAEGEGRGTAAFVDRMLAVYNDGALALGISLGHRTGLFDVMAALPPSPCETVAAEAGLDESCVRKWLDAMVCGGIVTWDPFLRTYALPRDHASVLTRRSEPDNWAAPLQLLPLLAGIEDELVGRFRGAAAPPGPPARRFGEVIAELADRRAVTAFFDDVLPAAPGVAPRLQAGTDVLEIGCGEGRRLVALASAYPNSRFHGVDPRPTAVAAAQRTIRELGLRNVELAAADPERVPGSFGLVVSFGVPCGGRTAAVLAGARAALGPDGVLLLQDMADAGGPGKGGRHPLGAFLHTLALAHGKEPCPESGDPTSGRSDLVGRLRRVGFGSVEVHALPRDPLHCFYVARTGAPRPGPGALPRR